MGLLFLQKLLDEKKPAISSCMQIRKFKLGFIMVLYDKNILGDIHK